MQILFMPPPPPPFSHIQVPSTSDDSNLADKEVILATLHQGAKKTFLDGLNKTSDAQAMTHDDTFGALAKAPGNATATRSPLGIASIITVIVNTVAIVNILIVCPLR